MSVCGGLCEPTQALCWAGPTPGSPRVEGETGPEGMLHQGKDMETVIHCSRLG